MFKINKIDMWLNLFLITSITASVVGPVLTNAAASLWAFSAAVLVTIGAVILIYQTYIVYKAYTND